MTFDPKAAEQLFGYVRIVFLDRELGDEAAQLLDRWATVERGDDVLGVLELGTGQRHPHVEGFAVEPDRSQQHRKQRIHDRTPPGKHMSGFVRCEVSGLLQPEFAECGAAVCQQFSGGIVQ